ncbi:MAG TPA: DUF5103 domain-containing protein [Bacteroidales bacterium]|nr:DUF5103 domain-containing protein [Bacteroidales bacterium]HPJ59860.1 DUF5103 domain-containing protein [Bacteroidales bacterium]HPR12692.1 DUF5103 domain-containing protein [Bacteroidales bacterium]HRW86039.1 DUF5103 domain-containing protein [Bacteroidales bacterium]
MKKIFIAVIILLYQLEISAQGFSSEDGTFGNKVFDPRIRSVRMFTEGWNLSYPVIRLNSGEKLVFMFDLLGNTSESYYYTFIHCDKDWNRSDIFPNDFMEGFPDNPIEDMNPSFNTTVNYFHYNLTFPNERSGLKISGNYILFVYQADNPEKPVITYRFIVKEDAAKVNIRVKRPMISPAKESGQQIEFSVDIGGAGLIDPYRNVYSSLLQNGRWDNSRNNLKPDVHGGNELIYNSLSDKNIFNGGNEFRYFDIRSIRRLTENVRRIDYNAPYYHVALAPSESREFKPYFYWQDFNGKYYVAVEEGRDPETDGDYLFTYFTLASGDMIAGGEVYVTGSFCNWTTGKENLMIYNPAEREYECTLQLKQGWYNYQYVFVSDIDGSCNPVKFEGSHTETENDYMVIIYYRNPRGRYDRIIGTGTINTLNRITY